MVAKVIEALGRSIQVDCLEFDLPNNLLMNFEQLLSLDYGICVIVFAEIDTVCAFNNFMKICEIAKKVNFHVSLDVHLSEMWDFCYADSPFNNYIEMIDYINEILNNLKKENCSISVVSKVEY